MSTADPVAVFKQCNTSVVSDALDEHGIDTLITGLTPAHPDHAATGRARPLRFERGPGDDETNFPMAMFECIAPDELFVISGVSQTLSCWGDSASELAATGGMAGTLIDGGYRDAREVRQHPYPVFGRATTPRSGKGRVHIPSTDEPVPIDGVEVAPGDIVVADASGVLVVPQEQEAAVAKTAREMLSNEADLDDKIADGADVDAIRENFQS